MILVGNGIILPSIYLLKTMIGNDGLPIFWIEIKLKVLEFNNIGHNSGKF